MKLCVVNCSLTIMIFPNVDKNEPLVRWHCGGSCHIYGGIKLQRTVTSFFTHLRDAERL